MSTADPRLLERVAWGIAGGGAAVLATQLARWSGHRAAAVGQSLTPLLAVCCVPAAAVGIARRDAVLTALASSSAVGLAAVVLPALSYGPGLRRRPNRPGKDRSGSPSARPSLTVAHQNMLYKNRRLAPEAAATMLALGADVVVMSEFTEHHRRALVDLGGEERYPFRVGRTGRKSEGIVIWSTLELSDVAQMPMVRRPGICAVVAHPAGPVRVVAAHPHPPTSKAGLRNWEPSMREIATLGSSPGPPTLIVGDLNAARWHPPLRRLIANGWKDAHELVGRGLSASWPCGSRFVVPFVRLDHALVGQGLDLLDVRDFQVAGSDHRGFVVRVSTAARQDRVDQSRMTFPDLPELIVSNPST